MNTTWKISTLTLSAVMSLTSVLAQQDTKEKTEKRSKTITVVTDSDKKESEKVIIEVIGDKVTINGKPAEEYKGDAVRVFTRDNHKIPAAGAWTPKMAQIPGFSGNGWNAININGAVLGLSSEDSEGGAKITEVTKDGAADKAGLKVGDIITKMNEYNVTDADDLPMAIRKFKPEDKITISYKRDGKAETTTATLQKNQLDPGHVSFGRNNVNFNSDNHSSRTFHYSGKPRLGVQIEDQEDGMGVKVLDISDESPAAKAGLKNNDVIISFNGKEVKGLDDIRESMKDVKIGDTVKVTYKRSGSVQNAEIKFPKPLKKGSI